MQDLYTSITTFPEPTNHTTSFSAVSNGSNKIDITWADAVGENIPVGYLLLANKTDSFSDPVDGVDPVNDFDLSDGSACVKIYIIIDNARYYRCGLLDEYLKTSKIKQIFLPPYSPNLNLIERLWKFMKKKIIYNKYYEKSSEFRRKILDFFENIVDYKNELNTLLTCKFKILDSA